MDTNSKKYILLRGLQWGNRFFTNYTPGWDHTKLNNGTVAYEIIGYADTVEEAQRSLYPALERIRRDPAVEFGDFGG